jgi:hypothetical protein
MQFILIVLGLMLFPNDEMVEFRKNSNKNAEYRFVRTIECEEGLRPSGYAFTPKGRVTLKQVNEDGTVDLPVCKE